MLTPSDIANAIESGALTDGRFALVVKFLGRVATDVTYSIDKNIINFPYRSVTLTDWLRGLTDVKPWSVELKINNLK